MQNSTIIDKYPISTLGLLCLLHFLPSTLENLENRPIYRSRELKKSKEIIFKWLTRFNISLYLPGKCCTFEVL
jgi:hypothetical protein